MTYRFTQTESAGTVGLRSREAGVARQPRKRTYDLNLVRLRRLSDGAQTDCSRSPQPHAAARPGRPSRLLEVLIVVDAEHHDPGFGKVTGDVAGGGDPVEDRHANVHHHYVRSELSRERDTLCPVAGLPDDGEPDVLEQGP